MNIFCRIFSLFEYFCIQCGMKLSSLFLRCLNLKYTNVENCGSYALEIIGSTLYIYFQDSNGLTDWKNNLDFPARLKKGSDGIDYMCHRGFLRVWRSIEPYITPHICNKDYRSIIIVGYSHGGALAYLCHEHAWSLRSDIQNSIFGYGFGAPRVLWGLKSFLIRKRWNSFTVIRNIDDIVTHLPPALFGYLHAGTLLKIGAKGKYSGIDAHRPESILSELKLYEK